MQYLAYKLLLVSSVTRCNTARDEGQLTSRPLAPPESASASAGAPSPTCWYGYVSSSFGPMTATSAPFSQVLRILPHGEEIDTVTPWSWQTGQQTKHCRPLLTHVNIQ